MSTVVFGDGSTGSGAAGQWVSTGPVQVDGPDIEQSPAIAVLADGTYVVGWMEFNQAASGSTLLTPYAAMAQHYAAAGNKIGGEFQLSESPIAWPTLQLQATANGGFVALWSDGNQDGAMFSGSGSAPSGHTPPTMSHIERTFDANGNALSPEITLAPSVTESSPGALIREAHLAGGGTVVAWNGLNQADTYAFQLLDANGNVLGAPVAFGHDPDVGSVAGQYSTPLTMDVAAAPDGGFVAMYSVERSSYTVPGHTSASYLQHFDANGVATTALTPVPDASAVAVLPGGDVLLAGLPGNQQIEFTRIDASGAVTSDTTFALPAGGTATLGPTGATLTVLPDAGWLLSWEQNTPVPGAMLPVTQLYGERFDAQGHPVGGADLVTTFGNGPEAYDVKATPDGGVEYAWGNFKGGSDYRDVYMQHFGPAGAGPAPAGSNPGIVLQGGDGGATLQGTAGDDALSGGNGIDTAVFGGPLANYTITRTATGWTVTDNSGADGTDTLANIERLQFSDGGVALDIDGHGGQAYRLYQAAFDRAPDTSGLGFWIKSLDSGLPLSDAAQFFMDSPEFQARYGGPDANQFVQLLYQNVLHRAPDADGQAYWVAHLDGADLTRAQTLAFFSESAENQAALVGAMAHGMNYSA